MDNTLTNLRGRLPDYLKLVRMDKPIGSLLLLWPTLNALWIASGGVPRLSLLVIFALGTVLMRSAGCAVNDYFDRDFDRHVKRTAERPLTAGRIQPWEALAVAGVLAFIAFLLVLPLNGLSQWLSLGALLVAGSYPLTKRFFALPQAYLGIAFGFGIPMAFAAAQGTVPLLAWAMLGANVLWAIAYDTEYAMVDRDDDIRIGIRTSALTFGRFDILAVGLCYAGFLAFYGVLAAALHFHPVFWLGWLVATAFAVMHIKWISTRERARCFAAFLHNNWLGGVLFAGIAAHYALTASPTTH